MQFETNITDRLIAPGITLHTQIQYKIHHQNVCYIQKFYNIILGYIIININLILIYQIQYQFLFNRLFATFNYGNHWLTSGGLDQLNIMGTFPF